MPDGVHRDRQDSFGDAREESIDQSYSWMVVGHNILLSFHADFGAHSFRCRLDGLHKEKRTGVQVSNR